MDERDWTTATPVPGDEMSETGLRIRCLPAAGATLVSGDLAAAITALSPGAPILGFLEQAPGRPFALRVARDRALLCTDAPLGVEGWQDGFAASAADDLYVEIAVDGPRAPDLLSACTGTEGTSPSAAILLAGIGVLVSGAPDGFSLRVQAPEAAALWSYLGRLAQVI
ncbi:hypothetical protein BOO69_15000 [Sulfitobacter alexandrii]|uniref:Sarcosine oxidase subunit gamma n=1 Tax=Sulfitobacter alexandrii TaxID=1917485 RepID=A0A1J0WJQ9_9RHOB|nr:hypothetical protein [Sulfitobacter alexandrii]APE44575.1 hypothetical protein BOO69_15000 [Sulfitobacter alexandrii]